MTISIDIIDDRYILTGAIDSIVSFRNRKSNFRSIGAMFDSDTQISVPYSQGDSRDGYERKYKLIVKLCEKHRIEYRNSNSVTQQLKSLHQKNIDFEKFSERARTIRNKDNEYIADDFQLFSDVVFENLKRSLYDRQLLSAYHLAFAQNACNFSVPGAGKTSIVYAAYSYLKTLSPDDSKYVNKLLVISPLSAFGSWSDEYNECFESESRIKQLVGFEQQERKNYYYSDKPEEVTLISYQTASQDSDTLAIIDFLKNEKNRVMIVLDEAHRIKNVEGGKWAEAILSMAEYACARVVLTGTPAPNGYEDLYNLYRFIWPDKDIIGFPLNYLQGMTQVATPIDKQELLDRISPFFIRIKKSHLGLPEPIEHEPNKIIMSSNQKFIYEYIEQKYIDSFEKEEAGFLSELKRAKLLRLMQCATNIKLLKKPLDKYHNAGTPSSLGISNREAIALLESVEIQDEVPPKFIATENLINKMIVKEGPDGRVVVWAIFIQNILELREYLQNQGIQCELLYGDTPTEGDEAMDILSRQEIIRQFHKPDCPFKVIIANPFAVGESISLHKACRNAIYLERNFNAGTYVQSKDRINRFGLRKGDIVNYHYLVTENSVDETIHERLLEKEKRMLEIIEGEEIPLLNMDMGIEGDDSDENIRAIIRDYHARKSA